MPSREEQIRKMDQALQFAILERIERYPLFHMGSTHPELNTPRKRDTKARTAATLFINTLLVDAEEIPFDSPVWQAACGRLGIPPTLEGINAFLDEGTSDA